MFSHRAVFLTLGLLLSPTILLTAEEAAEVTLDPLVVTASRLALSPDEVPVGLNQFDRDDVRLSSALTADDFLRQVPGFSLFRRTSSLTANPTAQGFTLRGIGPSGTSRGLVLYDGAPLNDAFGGWVYWSKIDLDQVESIEVVRGGGSAAWGNAALSGVVQILPAPIDRTGGNLTLLAGSQGTLGTSSRVQAVHGNWATAVEGRAFRTDGFQRVREDQRGAVDTRANSRHESIAAILEHRSEEGGFFRGRATYFNERRDNGTPLTDNSTEAWRWQHRYRFPGGGNAEVTTWTGFAEYSRFASTFSSVAGDRNSEFLVLDQFRVPSFTVGSGLTHERTWGNDQSITLGADGRYIRGETNERVVLPNLIREAGGEQILAGVFFENLSPLGDATTLSSGLRLDLWHNFDGFQSLGPAGLAGSGSRQDFSDRTELLLSPRLGVTSRLSPQHLVRGAVYQGFRAPTINELYRPFQVGADRTFANEELDPEILTGVEIGWAWNPNETLSSDLTFFWNDLRDSVANVTLGPNPLGGADRQRQNIDRTRVRGIEWEGRYQPTESVEFFLRHALIDARIRRAGNQPELEGNRLAQVARQQGNTGVRLFHPAGLTLTAQLRYEGPRFEEDTNTRRLDNLAVVDFLASQEWGDQWRVFAAVENVFDRTYQDGRPGDELVTVGQPRLFSGGVSLSF